MSFLQNKNKHVVPRRKYASQSKISPDTRTAYEAEWEKLVNWMAPTLPAAGVTEAAVANYLTEKSESGVVPNSLYTTFSMLKHQAKEILGLNLDSFTRVKEMLAGTEKTSDHVPRKNLLKY